MLKKSEILSGLAQCIGTEQYWVSRWLRFKYTDGIKFLWESCESYWLLTAISSHMKKQPFQVWNLKKNADNSALLTMKTSKKNIVEQKIPYTNFPLDEIEIYLIDGVLLLKSEY